MPSPKGLTIPWTVLTLSNAKVKKEPKHIHNMDNTIVVPQSVRVLVKMGNKRKGKRVETLVGMLKEYKNKYTSVELQEEAMKWWRESI